MKVVTVSGHASAGKTAVILHIAHIYMASGKKVGGAKFDCLTTEDDELYAKNGIKVLTGLSGNLCPDHFYVSSVLTCNDWGMKKELDVLFLESAGLCNRCSPHLKDIASICVIDNLMGAKTPRKIGPMLKKADIIDKVKFHIYRVFFRTVILLSWYYTR